MTPAHNQGTWITSCLDAVQVLLVHHLEDDTYAITDDGGVYLSDKATLTLLLKQLSGREDP